MSDERPNSKKSKVMEKQLDIRQFMLKETKSQETPSSSSEDNEVPFNVSESHSSQSFTSTQTQENNVELNSPSVFSELLQLVLPSDLGKRKNILFDFVRGDIRSEYEACLKVSLISLRFLLRQGLIFCENDEDGEPISSDSFIELLKLLAEYNEGVKKVITENPLHINQIASPEIQKDLINCCAKETTKHIIQGLGDDYFGIFVDVSTDVSHEEQLALCLRYVDGKTGMVVERFLGLVHVGESDVTALSLKNAVISLLKKHSLSSSKIRGLGYNGACNYLCQINGLKSLIMKDYPCAYYFHTFAHQLQLTLVAVAQKNDDCGWFFWMFSKLLDAVGSSCKRREMVEVSQAQKVAQALEYEEFESGSNLNEKLSLKRFGDARFGYHYRTISNVIDMFPTVIEVLVMIEENVSFMEGVVKAGPVLDSMESFDFVFMAHLMLVILGHTHHLCLALEKRDIVNAITLVSSTKLLLLQERDCGWEALLNKAISFCTKHDIDIPDMEASYTPKGRSRRFVQQETNLQHYQSRVFVGVIDLQLNELNDRFDEVNLELLTCMTCLSSRDGFPSFDKKKLLKFATFYPSEFSDIDLMALDLQLDVFIEDMRRDDRFEDVNDLGALSMMLVKTNKHVIYSAIYLLFKLMLILPVAAAGVERVISGMTIVKNRLRNCEGDQLLNDCLVTFIEDDVFLQTSDDDIIDRFQKMKNQQA